MDELSAFILITTRKGTAWHVADQVQKLDGVATAVAVAGAFDVIAVLHIKYEELGSVVKRIQNLEEVVQTVSFVQVFAPEQ